MEYVIRMLDGSSARELDCVTQWAMEAPLESVPELERSAEKARERWPNFNVRDMRAMIVDSLTKRTHAFLIAEGGDGRLLGHSMIFHKVDEQGQPFGYFFTRYVRPDARRRGIATALLQAALDWFDGHNLRYLQAHTHTTNAGTRRLFENEGFKVVARTTSPWATLELRKDLP